MPTTTATPENTALHLRAYSEIKRLIVSGEFPADSHLSERQLAQRLGMCQQGVVVRGRAPLEILDPDELREAIEIYIVRTLAGRLSPARVLATFLGNRQIQATMSQLQAKIRQVILRISTLHRARFEESVREHSVLAGHLVEGDAEAAEMALIGHLHAGKRRILARETRPSRSGAGSGS